MRPSPFRVRRHALDILLGDAEAPLHVVPQTRDAAEAQSWLASYAEAHVGIDGVVAKGLGTTYEPGGTSWSEVRIQASAECVVGAVVGSIRAPQRLILGLLDENGLLGPVGCTTELTLPESRRVAALLSPDHGDNPWKLEQAIASTPGWTGPTDVAAELVDPRVVVEVTSETPDQVGPWSTPRDFLRSRPHLVPDELHDRWVHA